MKSLVTLAAVAVLAAGCGQSASASGPNDATKVACGHWRLAAQDYSNGILTHAEMRKRLQDVQSYAQGSNVPGFANKATRLLAVFTQPINGKSAGNVAAFNKACSQIGQ